MDDEWVYHLHLNWRDDKVYCDMPNCGYRSPSTTSMADAVCFAFYHWQDDHDYDC